MTKKSVGSRASGMCAGALLVAMAASPAAAQPSDPIGQGLASAMKRAGVAAVATSAADAEPQDKPADKPAENPVLKFFEGTELTGFVDTYYHYNFNTPETACGTVGGVVISTCLHNFEVAHNAFSLNLMELALEKKPTADSRGGFRIDLDYGPTAALVHGFEPGGQQVWQNIEQAYISYLAPTGKGLQFDFGKFVTQHGAEVIETKDNWNYSRSLLFALAIPYYHMGVRVSYSPSDKLTLMGDLTNGWNNAVDNNTGKTVGFQAMYKPDAKTSIIANYMGGPEQTNNNDDWRHLFDATVTYTATPQVSLMANYDYGHESYGSASSQTWQGIALYAKYQPNAWFALVPRYEFLNDKDGWAFIGQNVQEFTLTAEFKHKDGVLMRVEYRGDFAQNPFFPKNSSELSKTQNVVTIGWIYAFSSKTP